MKRFFRSAAVAAAMLAGFVACNNAETEIDTFESSTEEALELTDSASVTISHSIEYLRSFEGGKALCAKINNLILRICLGDEYDGLSFGEASQALMERQVTDYQKEAGEEYKSNPETESYWIYKWSYSVDGKFAESFQDLQTYDVLSDVYLGGAHGMQSMIPHVINHPPGFRHHSYRWFRYRELLFSDFFQYKFLPFTSSANLRVLHPFFRKSLNPPLNSALFCIFLLYININKFHHLNFLFYPTLSFIQRLNFN